MQAKQSIPGQVCQLSEIIQFRETNKHLFRSNDINSDIEFFIARKYKKENIIDQNTYELEIQRNMLKQTNNFSNCNFLNLL